MWIRKRIDIGWSDLAFGFLQCLLPGSLRQAQARLESQWSTDGQSMACLSVRTGWDLFLTAAGWPPGSEVLVSAITIPDMVRVIEAHGLVAVPLDVDADAVLPTPETIRERTTPRTRAVLLAPLFGSYVSLDRHFDVAGELNLQTIVDCAQAYRGAEFRGERRSDVSMFSFGPIKSATALGGALLRVRNPELLSRMRDVQSPFPRQSRAAFARRIIKYALIKMLSTRAGLRLLMNFARRLGREPDDWLNAAARGFPAGELLDALRRRPAAPLLRLLERRLRRDDPLRRELRTQAGQFLAHRLADACVCPTAGLPSHTFWVFPILVDNPAAVRQRLHSAGFDSSLAHSLRVVPSPPNDARSAPGAENLLQRLVFLPLDERMPPGELERMADVVIQAVAGGRTPI